MILVRCSSYCDLVIVYVVVIYIQLGNVSLSRMCQLCVTAAS